MTEPELNPYLWMMVLLTLAIALSSLILWARNGRRSLLKFETNASYLSLSPWSITWVDFGIFLFALFIAVFACQSIASKLLPEIPDADSQVLLDPLTAIASILSLQLPILLVYFAFQKFYSSDYALKLSSRSSHWLMDFKESLLSFIQYLPLIWLCSMAWTLFLTLLQKWSLIETFPAQPIIELLGTDLPLLQIVLLAAFAILLAPLVEEVLFRGCLYRFLKGKMTLLNAQILSAILFALVHTNLAAFLPLVLIGFLLVRIYETSGSIKQAIFFHAFFNANSFLFLSLAKLSGIPLE
jgi:membrane protease YdiL (CAAX protease family)